MPDELDDGQFDGSAVGTSDRLGVEVGSVDGVLEGGMVESLKNLEPSLKVIISSPIW